MIKVYHINRITNKKTLIPYQDGFNINQVYNEQLDNGTIIIPYVDELNIKRLDFIEIDVDNEIYNIFCVGTIQKEYATFDTPYKYNYTLGLVSLTILLQDKVLPNISVTHSLIADKYSIYYEINRLIKVFAKEFIISDELKTLTKNEICPEFQWNRKTLFEILNDMLSVVSAVINVKLINNQLVLDYISLIPNDVEIDRNVIIDANEEETIDDYCNEIEMNAENVVSGDFNTFSLRNITPRTEEYILTTDNCQLLLDKPIYAIKKIEMFIPKTINLNIKVNESPNIKNVEIKPRYFDITKWVIEESVYATKKTFDNIGGNIWDYYKYQRADGTYSKDYKVSYLSYKLGNSTIDNLTFVEPDVFGSRADFTIRNIAYYVIWDYLEQIEPNFINIDTRWSSISFPDPRKVLFNIDYKSLGDLRFRLKKQTNDILNNKLIIDSQANSYVDADALLKNEQENINRLGNKTLTIDAIFNSINELPTYGNRFDDYVLSQAQMQIFNEKIYWKGQFTKDFVRKNLFTGIRSKARYTSIAKNEEALTRKDLIIQDMNFDTTSGTELIKFSKMLLEHLGNDDNQFQVVIRTEQIDTGVSEYILMPTSRYILGNNIILGFKMKDNFNANLSIDKTSTTDAYTQKQVSYVDKDGEFESIYIYFTRINPYIAPTTESINQWIKWSADYPVIEFNRFSSIQEKDSINFLVKKDNREIYSADIQLHFKSINDKIIVYDRFIKTMPIIIGKPREPYNVQAFYNTDSTIYTKDDTKVKGNVEFVEYFVENNKLLKPTESNGTWGLCNASGDLLIVCNENKDIYLKGGYNKLC